MTRRDRLVTGDATVDLTLTDCPKTNELDTYVDTNSVINPYLYYGVF
jgi:hypothetical protein